MTIHGTGYRGYDEPPNGPLARLWPLALGEFLVLFRTRLGLLAVFVMALPFLIQLVLLLIQTGLLSFAEGMEERLSRRIQADEGSRFSVFAPSFYLFAASPMAFALFLIPGTLVLCRAVAKDRQSNALELFWTRPISPAGYFAAKWFGGFLLIGAVWIAGPLILWILGWLTGPDDFAAQTLAFVPRVVAAEAFAAAATTGLAVALSTTTRRANFASIQFVLLLLGAQAVARAAKTVLREDWLGVLAPWDAMVRVSESIAGVPPARDLPLGGALLVLGGLAAVLGWIARSRLRVEEALS